MRISEESPLVLGSGSPRRRDLLRVAGVPFVVLVANADESPRPAELALDYLERVTRTKLDAVRRGDIHALGGADAILVADTIVLAPDGAILGKPRDEEDARAMVLRLAGATHTVRTRFLLAERDLRAPPSYGATVTTAVTFRNLSAREASRYAASGEGRDKAGGYAAQGAAAAFVERIEGSYTNVVGLPLSEVLTALRALGWLSA